MKFFLSQYFLIKKFIMLSWGGLSSRPGLNSLCREGFMGYCFQTLAWFVPGYLFPLLQQSQTRSCLGTNKPILFIVFNMAFCLKGKAMVMGPPVSLGVISILGGCVMTCKVCNWIRVVDFLMTVSWFLEVGCW